MYTYTRINSFCCGCAAQHAISETSKRHRTGQSSSALVKPAPEMSASSLLSSSVYQQPVIHCSSVQCVREHVLCVGLCVSVHGAAEELGVQPLNVLSACHAEWADVVRPPSVCFTPLSSKFLSTHLVALLAFSTLTHHYKHKTTLYLFFFYTNST